MLIFKCSTHGLKQSNYNFYQKLSNALKDRGISPCKTEICVHASRNLILVVCVDDVIIFSPKKLWIDLFIKYLMDGSENFKLTDEGNIDTYLGVVISKHRDETYELKQPHLTKRIVEELNLAQVETQKLLAPLSSPLLHKDLCGKERVKHWNYRLVIGMMTYLQGVSRPDISMAVHQCALFFNPKIDT